MTPLFLAVVAGVVVVVVVVVVLFELVHFAEICTLNYEHLLVIAAFAPQRPRYNVHRSKENERYCTPVVNGASSPNIE